MASTGTWYVYAGAILGLAKKEIDWVNDATIKAILTTSAHTPNKLTHSFYSSITNEVATGGGYTAKGIALTSKTITLVSNEQRFDAADLLWATSTITARNIHIFQDTGTAGTSRLIAYCTLSADEISVSGNWPHTFDATGIFGVSV